MLKKIKIKPSFLNPSILLFGTLIVLGSFYRYIRIYPFFNNVQYLPYILEVIIFIFVLLKFKKITNNWDNMDALFSIFILSSSISYLILGIQIGYWNQIEFLLTYILPTFMYYFVKNNNKITFYMIDHLLKIFVIVAFVFLSTEFYTTNYLGVPFFNFAQYWDSTGNIGYHASAVNYLFLGKLNRPWGPMALPQSSGSMFASFFTYFLAKHVYLVPIHKSNKKTFFYLIISFLGTYISGSRTALTTIAVIILILYAKSSFKLIFASVVSVVLLVIFVKFGSQEASVEGFKNVIPETSEGLTIDSIERFFEVIYGQGSPTPNNKVIGTSEIHILNQIFIIGIVSFFILFLIAIKLKGFNKKQKEIYIINNLYSRAFTIYILSSAIGSLHYDVIFRYPNNNIILIMIGYISREFMKVNKYRLPVAITT